MSDDIEKVSQLLDESDNTWHDVYEAPGAEGNRITVVVPRDIREPGNLRKSLLRGGANVPPLDHCRGALTAASEADAPIARRAGATGWRDDNSRVVSRLSCSRRSSQMPRADVRHRQLDACAYDGAKRT